MPPCEGKSFRADFEEIHTRTSTGQVLRCRGTVAQDANGRVREDTFFPDPEEESRTKRVMAIFDATTLSYYFIDEDTKRTQKIDLGRFVREGHAAVPQPRPIPPQGSVPASQPEGVSVEAIPCARTVEGVLCRGSVMRQVDGRIVERWSSEELGPAFPVIEITRTKDLETVYKLSNIQLTKPDPTLFAIPGNL